MHTKTTTRHSTNQSVSMLVREHLNAILGFSDLLGNEQALGPRERRFAENIHIAGTALLHRVLALFPDSRADVEWHDRNVVRDSEGVIE